MHIFDDLHAQIISAITEMGVKLPTASLKHITVTAPKEHIFGCATTNAAMIIAAQLKQNPRKIATDISTILSTKISYLTKTEIAGPGFINFYLADEVWQQFLQQVLVADIKYGEVNIGKGSKVNLEYASPNPTGPVHIVHARGAVYGDALATILAKAGFVVTKENYVNDAGGQIDILARSVYIRYVALVEKTEATIPEGLYPGEYLIPVAEAIFAQYGDKFIAKDSTEYLPIFREVAVQHMTAMIKTNLQELNVKHDIFTSELSLHKNNKIDQTLDLLEAKQQLYRGVLEPPKGKKLDDWEPREQLLFKSTAHGDDVDRALLKSDNSPTYYAADAAYHLDKIERGFDKLILILGADHAGYVKRMKALV